MVFQKGYTPHNKGIKKVNVERKKYYDNRCNHYYCHNASKTYFCSLDCKIAEARRRQLARDMNPISKRKKQRIFKRLVKEILNTPLIIID